MKTKKINNKLFSITNFLIQEHKIMEPVKIQKILYFLYLEYLKEKNKKLFEDEFEAWVYGPVLRSVYNHLRYNGLFFNEYETFDTNNGYYFVKINPLKNNEIINFINKKIRKYKNMNTFDLVKEAHETEPWIKARKGLGENEPSTEKIKYLDIENFVKKWQPLDGRLSKIRNKLNLIVLL